MQNIDTYQIGRKDLSKVPDWKLYGFKNEKEYGMWLDFNSKGDDTYDNFKENITQ
jgi:hypothetical protein